MANHPVLQRIVHAVTCWGRCVKLQRVPSGFGLLSTNESARCEEPGELGAECKTRSGVGSECGGDVEMIDK